MFKKFSTKLEKLFEKSAHASPYSEQYFAEMQDDFQIVYNNKILENLSYVFSNEINSDNLRNLFAQLSSYFEIGFLLKKSSKSPDKSTIYNVALYNVLSAFAFRQKINLSESLKPIKLPFPGLHKVLRTPALQILNRLGLKSLDPKEKMTSYLMPITDNCSIVVMTQIAEPWAKLKVETLHKTFLKINFSL